MDVLQLQAALARTEHYRGALDGIYGRRTRAAVVDALTDGPDTPLTAAEVAEAAERLNVPAACIHAVWSVEASGAAFTDGRPTLLFEPHRFSRATGGRHDEAHPHVSYRDWDRRRYPAGQLARYRQLLTAVGLDVDAGFASASYGGAQILGENFALCGFATPFAFAVAQAHSEATQLRAFVRFVAAKGLAPALRDRDWAAFARGYNGTGYRANAYDRKLAAAFAREERRA